jgi:small nuclear ribonucleoprotein G
VTGNLRGFDQFMNIVLDNTVEEVSETERNDMGLVVRVQPCAEAFLLA